MKDKPRCSKVVYHCPGMSFPRPRQCSRTGTVKRDGKLWCAQHDPQRVKSDNDERDRINRERQQVQVSIQERGAELGAQLGCGKVNYSFYGKDGGYTRQLVISFEDAEELLTRLAGRSAK